MSIEDELYLQGSTIRSFVLQFLLQVFSVKKIKPKLRDVSLLDSGFTWFFNWFRSDQQKVCSESASCVHQHCAWALKVRRQQTYNRNQCPLWNFNQHRPQKSYY